MSFETLPPSSLSIKIGDKKDIELVIPNIESEDQSEETLKRISVIFDDRCSKFASYKERTQTIRFTGSKVKESGFCNVIINLINIYNESYPYGI